MAKTKGTNLVDMVRFLRTQRDAARALLPQHLHSYLETQLNVSAWYPEEDMIELVRVLAKLLPRGGEEPLVHIGRLNARMHLQGAYAHLLKDARPDLLPIRALALWKSMHDTGEFLLMVDESCADARLTDFGYPTAEMCTMLGAYLHELFVMAGVRNPKVIEHACCCQGARACCWRIDWMPEAASFSLRSREA